MLRPHRVAGVHVHKIAQWSQGRRGRATRGMMGGKVVRLGLPSCPLPHTALQCCLQRGRDTRGAASCACPCKIVSIRLARSTLSPPEGP